jgi:hypothetical protein
MERDGLKELQRLFYEAVMVGGPYHGEHVLSTPLLARVPPSCWFQDHIPGLDPCGGDWGPDKLEAAHWIKRQQVERWVKSQYGPYASPAFDLRGWKEDQEDIVRLAVWDPRNAVPACEKHHRRFDSQRMPTLVVPRRLVPEHVVEFTDDYGLETALEDRNPEEVYGAPE